MFKRYVFSGILLIAVFALVSCAPPAEVVEEPAVLPTDPSPPQDPTDQPVEEPIIEPVAEPADRIYFEQLGISLEVPEGIVAIKDPTVNLDDPSKLQNYLFYLQNYGSSEGPGEDYFQIYGHLQYGLPQITWEDYKNEILNSDMYQYAREIEINGLPGLDTQFIGPRNRFVYHFMLDGLVLTMAVADPTEENKDLADQIISTLEYSPGSVTNASGVLLVSEPNGYYQMYIPDDWEYNFGPQMGIRLSDLWGYSPNAAMVAEATGGSHDNISYKSGIFISVVVLNDDSAKDEPVMALTRRSNPLMISGIEGMDYVFLEPSTVEGEIRELRYFHNGLSYLVRFNYAENADQDQIDWLIRNFQITP
jgi:hypothetical protein